MGTFLHSIISKTLLVLMLLGLSSTGAFTMSSQEKLSQGTPQNDLLNSQLNRYSVFNEEHSNNHENLPIEETAEDNEEENENKGKKLKAKRKLQFEDRVINNGSFYIHVLSKPSTLSIVNGLSLEGDAAGLSKSNAPTRRIHLLLEVFRI